jgi:HEAT repeat protein/beta-lactamase regulating signal transducer with metallopeptidase domain
MVAAPAVRDLLWKAGVVGGLVTASLQTGLGFEPLGGAVSLGPRQVAVSRPVAVTAPISTRADAWRGLLPVEDPVTPVAVPSAVVGSPTSPLAALPAPVAVETASPSVAAYPTGGVSGWMLPAGLVVWAVIAFALCGLYLVQRARAMRRIGPRRQVSDVALLDMLDGLRRAGRVRRIVRLTAAEGLASPVALGRDEIALPEAALTDLDREQQRSMLAHELAHLERRDPTWLALGCLIERAFFLQPLNRLARVRIQEAAEYLCDDWAVHRTGSGVSLATCLVKVAEWVDTTPQPIPLAGMAERRSQLVTRIHRLIEGRAMSTSPRSFWFLAGAVALVGVTAVAAPGFTTGGTDLVAQGTGQAPTVSEPDSGTSWYGKLRWEVARARRLAHIDARRAQFTAHRAMLEARAHLAAAPMPPMAPLPPSAPAAPIISADLSRSLSHLGQVDWGFSGGKQGERQRDTSNIAVPALIAALKDQDVEVRRAAAQSLANLEDIRAVPALIDATRDTDAEVRASAIRGLGELGDKRATPSLIVALKDPVKDVKESALNALHEMPGEVPDEAILAALNDADSEIRQAAMSLARARISSGDDDEHRVVDPRYVTAFSRLLTDTDADVRSEAASALGEAGLKEAPAALLAAAKDKNADVRQNVACALGRIHDPKAVATLKEMLQDANSDVREQAVDALSDIRDRAALEALVSALKSTDPVVRRQAAQALGQRDQD